MIKVLIVEDEQAARERLISMAIWQSGEYTICGEAKNGREGLYFFDTTTPDIIITDIEMPVMNGLDFIAAVRKKNETIPIIILSCYESFSYAQKAIKLKVQDYLIKDFLEQEVLRSALLNTAERTRVHARNKEISSRFDVEITSALFTLFEEHNQNSMKNLKERFSRKKYFFLLLAQVDYYDYDITDIGAVMEKIKEKLESECDSIISNMGNGKLAMLLTPEDTKKVNPDIPARIIDYVDHHCHITLTIAANNPFTTFSEIQSIFKSTKKLLHYRMFLGHRRVIIPAHIQNVIWRDPELTEHTLHMIKQAMIQNDKTLFFKRLETLFKMEASGMIQFNYIEYVTTALLAMIMTYIEIHHLELSEEINVSIQKFHEVHSLETMEDMYRWFINRFTELFTITSEEGITKIENIHIRELIHIIKTEYKGNLSLETLANRIGIHKVYLSRLFKKETGKTCYDYIQYIRIQKSKKLLLSTSDSIANVAKATGFRSYDQFAVVFKKLTGATPTDFQKKYK